MSKLISILMICGLAGCTADRTIYYAGPLQALLGLCDPSLRAEVSLRRQFALFIPSSGTLVLHGKNVGSDVNAEQVVLTPEHKTYTLSFAGVVGADSIEGRYVTPRCRYHVQLWRVHE